MYEKSFRDKADVFIVRPEVGFHILGAVKEFILAYLRSLRLNPKYSTSKFELVWISEHFDEIIALELFLLIPFTKPVNRYQVDNQ